MVRGSQRTVGTMVNSKANTKKSSKLWKQSTGLVSQHESTGQIGPRGHQFATSDSSSSVTEKDTEAPIEEVICPKPCNL